MDFLEKKYNQDKKLTNIRCFGGLCLVAFPFIFFMILVQVSWYVWCGLCLINTVALATVVCLEERRKKQIRNKYLRNDL